MRDAIQALAALPCGARLLETLGDTDGVWLVGGAVRDLLLGREPRELDLAVEHDVDDVAGRLGEVVERHERFGTATVEQGACRFDLAQTRTERYPQPGALPEVTIGATLPDDLHRRDLTVNAIALSLRGEVVAVDDALDDLAAERLRVLHERSFIDDPTRLWRLARYSARLGFEIEEQTARRAAEAVAAGALDTVSGDRIGSELKLALGEADPVAALQAAAGLGLLEIALDGDRLASALTLLAGEGRADLLTAGLAGIDVAGLGFTAEEEHVVARVRETLPAPDARHSAIAAHYVFEPAEAVAAAGGAGAEWWLREGRQVALEITGDDLLAAGIPQGPGVGVRLRRALDAKLDGDVSGREEELRAALQ